MKVIVNNEEKEYQTGITLEILVQEFKGNQNISHVGAWVNNRMFRPDAYDKVTIKENDKVNILRFAAGG